jgi:hypothetical protein
LTAIRDVKSPGRRAQLIASLAASLPARRVTELLSELHDIHSYPRACALSRIAAFAPVPALAEILRVAPWREAPSNDRMQEVLSHLKTYERVLPPALVRTVTVALLRDLYRRLADIHGISGELLSSGKYDPHPPPDGFWPASSLALDCSAYTPEAPAPGKWFVLSIWLHQPRDRARVRSAAKGAGRDSLVGRTTGSVATPGNAVTFMLKANDLEIRDGSTTVQSLERTVVWHGTPINIDFIMRVPGDKAEDTVFETVEVLVEGMKIADLILEIHLGQSLDPLSAHFRSVSSAFASYSRLDIQEVLARLQTIEKLAPGIRVFWDVESIRSGEHWRERLQAELLSRDVLFLFWSSHAAQSEWVNWEWQCALRQRGIDGIEPFPLDQTAPPPELAALQFADRWVRHLRYEELNRRATSGATNGPSALSGS